MRRVLFVAYHFPPVGGSGAQRPARLVQHLPNHGYEPSVLTGPGTAAGRWTPQDPTLVLHVPAATRVDRVEGPEPRQGGRRAKLERWLRVKSPWTRWWVDGASSAGAQRGGECDLVYVWMQPYASAAVGARLAKRLGLPWVADLGDPWAFDEMIAYPSRVHRALAVREMRRTLGSAAAVIMSTPEAAAVVSARFPEFAGKVVTAIPNGFDETDFAGVRPVSATDRFVIAHTGFLHTNLADRYRRFARLRRILGGRDADVDVSARSHVYLLEAVERLLDRRPDLHGRLEVHFAGVMSTEDRSAIGGRPFVRLHGYLEHGRAVELMRSADLLFLPMHDLPPGRRATIVPGKTYDYLASQTPILAAVPDGDARDLLEAAGNASVCRPTDVDALAQAIHDRIDGRVPPEPPRAEVVEPFRYAALAGRLATVFDRVLDGQAGSERAVLEPEATLRGRS